MANWFECKVRYDKTMENGAVKKVNEPYLLDALSFTEAEARMIEEITPFISGDFSISAVKRTKIAEIFWDDTADKWYLVKVAFITIDEKTAAEKKSTSMILVAANNFQGAVDAFVNIHDGGLGYRDDLIVGHSSLHAFNKSVDSTLKIIGSYENHGS